MLKEKKQKPLQLKVITCVTVGSVALFAMFLWILVEVNVVYVGPGVQASQPDNETTDTSVSKEKEKKDEGETGFTPLDTTPRLDIPSIETSSRIEESGLNEDGDMERPSTPEIVGRYKHGAYPGEGSNTVLAGHVDSLQEGEEGVFSDLDKLNHGDLVTFHTNSEAIDYKVIRMNTYTPANAPLEQIFGSSPRERLTLITCTGAWQQEEDAYQERLVVTAERVN